MPVVMMIPPAIMPVIVPIPMMASYIPFAAFARLFSATTRRRASAARHIHDHLNQAGEARRAAAHSRRRPGLLHLLREIFSFHFLAFQDVIINVVELA